MLHRFHLAVTALLALALVISLSVWLRDRREAAERLGARAQAEAALRRRAETAEANTRLVIERFATAMQAFANDAGHLSGRALRAHERSFVQLYSFYRKDRKAMATAATACYLGGGYFLTARHVVFPESTPGQPRIKASRIDIRIDNELVPVRVVDEGERRETDQIDIGDWAVLAADRAPDGLVPLKPTPGYQFNFGERLVRYGNDSNRGIAPAVGYVAQVSGDGWVSWLVDSLPGCSGGGVLNAKDQLVGLNGGYLDGNTRLAVIIPIRPEMFRALPKDLQTGIGAG